MSTSYEVFGWLLKHGVSSLAELHRDAVPETLRELHAQYIVQEAYETQRLTANIKNYASHKWVTKIQSIPGSEPEPVSYCEECGHSNGGDPREFDYMDYHNCADMASVDDQLSLHGGAL